MDCFRCCDSGEWDCFQCCEETVLGAVTEEGLLFGALWLLAKQPFSPLLADSLCSLGFLGIVSMEC